MLTKKKILNSELCIMLFLLAFFPPAYLRQNRAIDLALNALQMACFFLLAVFFISDIRKHFSKPFILLLFVLWGELLLSTLFSKNASLYTYVFSALSVIEVGILAAEIALHSPYAGLKSAYFYFSICVLINTITFILFPNALYARDIPAMYEIKSARVCWFLGDDNTGYSYYIIASTLAMAFCAYTKRRFTVLSLCVWASGYIFAFGRAIGSGMICQVVWTILFLIYHFKWIKKIIKARYVLYVAIGGFLVFVIFRSAIIEPIALSVGKSITLTGRTIVWDSLLKAMAQKPFMGFGICVEEEFSRIVHTYFWAAHNYILQLLFWGGINAVVLFILLIFFACKGSREIYKSDYCKCMIIGLIVILVRLIVEGGASTHLYFLLTMLAYSGEAVPALQRTVPQSSIEYENGLILPNLPKSSVNKTIGIKIVWKPPIWLEEDDGRATGIREENVSFGVFGTLIRRSVARPADLFRIMEQSDPNVPEHFAEKRMEAERAAYAKLGARMGLADIYEELLPLYGSRTNDLMALEIQYEIAGCRSVADNIDLVNLCMEHDKNVFLLADTYLPSSVLRRMLDVCGVYHYDRLYVSCEEGACKADGSLFWKVLADQEIRPHELRHIGSDRQGDIVEPWRVGVHVKRGKKKDQSAADKELPEGIALYERTMQSCIQNCADDLDSDNAHLGCETFGPLLAGFTAWLREQLRRDGIQDVYFLAGDSAVLKQAFDALEDGGFRTHSLYFPVQTADQDHEALVAYIRACGMQGRVALVDTGRVAVQKTLESLIAKAGLDIQVKGYYVGLNQNTDDMEAAGYLYERNKGKETLEKLSPVMAIFDTIFHAQHGAVRRIAMRDGQPVPELDAYEYASDEGRICDEIAILRAYQAGALALVHEMNEAFPGGVPQLPGEAVLLPLLRMGTKPTPQEAELWGDFRVFRDGKAVPMARPKGLGAYLLHPGRLKRDYAASPWKIGFLRRLIRFSFFYDKIAKRDARKR